MDPKKTRLIYEIRDLKKEYGPRTVVRVRQLQFHSGAVYGIIGSIGSGKTTLLKMLSGIEKPTSGSLLFEGNEFDTGWFGKIKKNENIYLASVDGLPLKSTIQQVMNDTYPEKAVKIKNRYFSKHPKKEMWTVTIDSLSPGERAWVAKILAVQSDPCVLLIDDYGTLMDNQMERDFRKRLMKMNKVFGTTLILAAPDDHQIKKFASVLIYLDNGHISKIRTGGMKAPNYRKR